VTPEETQALLEVLALPEPALKTAEERLRALEDKAQIWDLSPQYGYLCDARRWQDLLELYTDDIERTLAGTLREHVKGKAELLRKLEAPTLERRAGGVGPPPPARLQSFEIRHLMASEVIKLIGDGSEAKACVQYALVATAEEGGEFRRGVHEGSYVFSFRKLDGVWKFCAQLIFSDNARNPMFQAR
jgi:hypothetical protein